MRYYLFAIIDPECLDRVLCWSVIDVSTGKCMGIFFSDSEALSFIDKLKGKDAYREYVEKHAKNMKDILLQLSAEKNESNVKHTQEIMESFQKPSAPGMY